MLSAGVEGAEPCLDACLGDCLGGGGREREGKERGAIEEVEGVVAKECRNNSDACFLDKTGCEQGVMLGKTFTRNNSGLPGREVVIAG